jgi:signal peptidase II
VTDPQPDKTAAVPATDPRTKMRVFLLTGLIALTLDIISKALVVANIAPDDKSVRILWGGIYILQARNSGAAFSVGTGATVMLTAISVVVVIVIVRVARRLTSAAWAVSLGLVLGGALGNLVDRFLRAPSPGKGHVVDWISVFADNGDRYPIFNLADSSIVIGGAIAVLLSLRGVDFNGGRNPMEKDDDDEVDKDDQVARGDEVDKPATDA